LFNFYSDKKHLLTQESLELLDANPMQILSSEDEDEQILSKNAPNMTKFLKKDSKAHYAKFKEYLDLLEVPYTEDNTLIASNEYATHSIWEFRHSESNELISSGFRYNTL
jgi:histidyl-tRNA synthetase